MKEKMQLLNSVAIAAVVCACLAACGEKSNPSDAKGQVAPATPSQVAPAAPSPERIVVETASPDQVVKSWWRYLDALDSDAVSNCKKMQESASSARHDDLVQIAGNETLAAYDKKSECARDSFARTIDEVKTESETRAIVFSTIKNVTPIPSGVEPEKFDLKARKAGEKYKYLVEKSSGAWKVSQVYQYQESNRILGKDVWQKAYEPSKPYFPAYVPVAQ